MHRDLGIVLDRDSAPPPEQTGVERVGLHHLLWYDDKQR